MNRKAACFVFAVLAAGVSFAQQVNREVEVVQKVDLDRYAGNWYEIARFPNNFQKQCTANVAAEYKLRGDGQIDVINRCRKSDGAHDRASGVGRVVDLESNAKLKVRFAPAWLSWLPFVWGDYWIVGLPSDYSYAVVGGPSREYLWILSRTPALPDAAYKEALQQAADQGYDTSKLLKTVQEK